MSLLEKCESYKKRLDRFKTFYEKFLAQKNFLAKNLYEVQNKKKLICGDENPSCPLCLQNLSLKHKTSLEDNFSQQQSLFNHQLKRLNKINPLLHDTINRNQEELQRLQQLYQEQRIFEHTHQHQKKELTQVNELSDYLETDKKTVTLQIDKQKKIYENSVLNYNDYISKKEVILLTDPIYAEIKAQKKALEKSIQENTFNEIIYQDLVQKLSLINQSLNQLKNSEYGELKEQKWEIHSLNYAIKELIRKKIELHDTCKNLQNNADQLHEIIKKEPTLYAMQREIQNKKNFLMLQKGTSSEQLRILEERTLEISTIETKCLHAESMCNDFQILAQALSKDGIQALLIENALPEIEQEANYLLSKLTDNQAHLQFESLRDLKSGGTKETLDIKISDSIGIRPYELFSGGEAFRIDFALRIALSKLVARRAGTSLQTLIIDEGFGSQDEDGLAQIMDALYKIQDDFAKIIIVSHLPSMKDQFPVHFHINKGPSGSTLRVIEQG